MVGRRCNGSRSRDCAATAYPAAGNRVPLDGQRHRVYRADGQAGGEIRRDRHRQPGGGGEYPFQDGFGWTNGVTRELMVLYPADADLAGAEQCPGGGG